MNTLLKQEFYKLRHQTLAWLTPIVSIIVMTGASLFSKSKPEILNPVDAFGHGFYGDIFLIFFLIVLAATIITAEFQFGTIKALLYRKYSRGAIFLSKVLILGGYIIANYILIIAYNFILKIILFNQAFAVTDKIDGHSLITKLGLSLSASVLGVILILSLVLLIANLFKTSAAAITIGLISYFAATILQLVQVILISKWEWIKWNPLNMLNAGLQISDSSTQDVTHLSMGAIISGNLIYSLVFVLLAYLLFKNRNV